MKKSYIIENCECEFCGQMAKITNSAGSFTGNYCYGCLKMLRDVAIEAMREIREYKKDNKISGSLTKDVPSLEEAQEALKWLQGDNN